MKILDEQQAEAWRLAPDDADEIMQQVDGWWLHRNNVYHSFKYLYLGEINGWDWRDTLQSREDFEMLNKQELADNEWKDGLPPVGVECEADDSDSPNGVFKGVITAEGRNHYLIANDSWELPFHKHKVRPIQTKADKLRDKTIDIIDKILHSSPALMPREDAEILYDKGCRMTRELTDYAIHKIAVDKGTDDWYAFAKAIAAYVTGGDL